MAYVKYFVCGAICILLGVLVLIVGTIVVNYELPKEKLKNIVIDSHKSLKYKDWAGGYDVQNEYQMVFYFYNLTNSDAVRGFGAKPNYTTVGPYVYRRYRKSINVTFPDNGNEISFLDFRDYHYDPVASGPNNKTSYVTNVNPVYIAAMSQAGGEMNMLVAATGGYLSNFTNFLTGPFISLWTSYKLPEYLPTAVNNQIRSINDSLKDSDKSLDYFLDGWCNGTIRSNLTLGNWAGMFLSTHFNQATNISKASAQALLDPTIELSLLNTNNMTAWAWNQALNNTNYSVTLQRTFNLTRMQVEAIWWWRMESFGPVFFYPWAIKYYNLTVISDLGWAQWTAGYDILGGTVYAPISINDRYAPWVSEIGYYGDIELFVNFDDTVPFGNWSFSKQVLNPVTGLSNVLIFQDWANQTSQFDPNTNFGQWGLTTDQAMQLYGYSVIIGLGQVRTALSIVFGPSGGLILTQKVDDWVFNCNYFMIDLLLPIPEPCSLLLNHTVFANVTIYSGKNNLTLINQYIDWQGSNVVTGVWAKPIPVVGNTELGQFVPDQNKNTVLQTFNDEFVRTMTLNYHSDINVKNIQAQQFALNYSDTFSPNEVYFQTIPGFVNMTSVKMAPIFYSLWDMVNVDETIRNKVTGMNLNNTEFNASTVLAVEPLTGNAIQVAKRLQANIYTDPSCAWCTVGGSLFGNNNFSAGVFYPFVKAAEVSVISDGLASTVRRQLWALRHGKDVGLIVGLAVGIPVIVAGIALIGCGAYKSKNTGGYSELATGRN